MPLNAGDILFTSLITDDSGSPEIDSSFSFVATTNIAAGEVITFHHPESIGNSYFTYTVGVNGLQPNDFVRIGIPSSFTTPGQMPVFLTADPSNGSLTNMSGGTNTITGSGAGYWDMGSSDNVVAGSNGIAIAAHTNDSIAQPLVHLSFTGLDASGIGAAAVDLDQAQTTDDNAVWVGGVATTAEIGNAANWVYSNSDVDHFTGAIGGTTYATQEAATPCFAPGTLIATHAGEVAVETLKIGDTLLTSSGAEVRVAWIGRKLLHKSRYGAHMQPVRIRAGALGDGLPHSDLTVTADHGMVLDGMVINAAALVNLQSIDFVPLADIGDSFTVYHIETEAHNVILANGAPSETFVDAVGRSAFDNHQEYLDLYGADRIIAELDMPRIAAPRLVPQAIKDRLRQGAPKLSGAAA